MAKLSITAAQAAAVETSDTHYQDAFLTGTESPGPTPVLDPLTQYDTISDSWAGVKSPFKIVLAVIMKTLNIPQPLPVTKFTGTVTLAKLTELGATGSITFVDGICTTRTNPT